MLVISILLFFMFFAPPVVLGRLPGSWLGLGGFGEGELNKDPFSAQDGDDRKGFLVAFIVSFIVSAGLAIAAFL